MPLWNKGAEKEFFREAIRIAGLEQVFYKTKDNRLLAYWPKNYLGNKSTLQSRNTLIGAFTEKFCKELIETILPKGFYAIQKAICHELGLEGNSKADLVIARSNQQELQSRDLVIILK